MEWLFLVWSGHPAANRLRLFRASTAEERTMQKRRYFVVTRDDR